MTQAMKTSDPTDECTRSLCLKQSDRLIESNSDTIRDSVQMGDCLDRGCSHVENGSGDRDVQCLIDRVDDPFLILRLDGGIIYANATFAKSFEYCEKELQGKHICDLFPLECRDKAFERISPLIAEKTGTCTQEIIRRDGTRLPVEIRITMGRYYDEDVVLALCIDVSDRLQYERELMERESRLAQIIQGNSIATIVIDKNHTIMHWNLACERLTGLKAADMVGTNDHWKAFYPKKRPILADFIVDGKNPFEKYHKSQKNSARSGILEGSYEAESFFPEMGDNGKWLFFTAVPIRDCHGNITGAIETLQDVTDRTRALAKLQDYRDHLENLVQMRTQQLDVTNKLLSKELTERRIAEEALRHSEELYRSVVEDQNELICRLKPDQTITFVNNSFCRFFDKSSDAIVGHPIDPGVSRQVRLFMGNLIASLNKDCPAESTEIAMTLTNGEKRWVHWTLRAIMHEKDTPVEYQAVGRDVTRRREIQQRLEETHTRLVTEQVSLHRKNTALKELLHQIEQEKDFIKQRMQSNLNKLVLPIVDKLKHRLDGADLEYLDILESSLADITSPFINNLETKFSSLSPRETEICQMIRSGLSSKDIAATLHTSVYTVINQRRRIRKKLGISRDNVNLTSYLQSLSI